MRMFQSCATLLLLIGATVNAADFTGKWKFTIELDPIGWGQPTFFFEQKGTALSGKYTGALGERPVTGSVNGTTAEFSFTFDRAGKPVKAIYTGTMKTPTTMAGKLRFEGFFRHRCMDRH